MGNFFDIDCEQEYLVDFLEDTTEKISDIEHIVCKLDGRSSSDPSLITLIGIINTLKSNANESQVIPLASALDSLESILSKFSKQELIFPENFSNFILAIFEIASEMSEQAAEMKKVDFDLFSKIQNSLQPLSQCSTDAFAETISLSIALLSSEEGSSNDKSDVSVDLFGDDDSTNEDIELFGEDDAADVELFGEDDTALTADVELFGEDDTASTNDIELFDEPTPSKIVSPEKEPNDTSIGNKNQVYLTSKGEQFFTSIYNQRSIEDLQAFRLLADEAAPNNNHKINMVLYLARFMNAAAKNLVDASQLEAAVYLTELRTACSRKCPQELANMTVVPTVPGWELASSIVLFQNLNNPDLRDRDKSLGTQIFNGAQIIGLCFAFHNLVLDNHDPQVILQAKKDIARMSDRFSPFWIKIFLSLVGKVIQHMEKHVESNTFNTPSKRILCVDDDEVTLMVFEHMLTKAGHTPITVDNYDDAIKIIKIAAPDLILLDLNMPGKGGYWMIEEKKNNELLKNIPIAIISGSKDDYGIKESEVVGIYEKPISKQTMLDIINKACG